MIGSRIWQLCTPYVLSLQAWTGLDQTHVPSAEVLGISFSEEWKVLGPFQVGTREAVWGADPLEYHGGFRALPYDTAATFKSSLAFNGTVSWSTVKAELSPPDQKRFARAGAKLSISFPDIDWRFLHNVYGWAASQWQGYARGEIYVAPEGTKTLSLNVDRILEFWIDEIHYFGGDFYGYGRAAVTLRLEPGVHKIDVRLVRDARAMGGVGEPSIDVGLILEESNGLLVPVTKDDNDPYPGVLISDTIGGNFGPLASPYASTTFRNDALEDALITEIEATHNKCKAELIGPTPIKLIPGQTRPVAFRIVCAPPMGPIRVSFNYRLGPEGVNRTALISSWPPTRGLYDPQKVTYMHPGGMVSYAVLRPPSPDAHCANRSAPSPVLLQFHGAGLEADDDMVRHALDPLPDLCAWALFPTGATPWSGDDWHVWGFADVEAAVAAIPKWIEINEWRGPGVDVERWFVSGHSNGGQGVWYALTHRPDKIIAAAAISGYSSIQNYVPYTFWHAADSGKIAIINGALNSYRHELLLENAKGIPIFQQHGNEDDNVPAYHSRLLHQILGEASATSKFFELPGKPHWWDGVMTTEPLRDFYRDHLNSDGHGIGRQFELQDFTVVSSAHGDMGPKNGIEILELITPGQLGKIDVKYDRLKSTCTLHTSNVWSFRLPLLFRECGLLSVDGEEFSERPTADFGMTLMSGNDGRWVNGSVLPPLSKRSGRQKGAMDAILRTNGTFDIVYHSPEAKHVALQISRNLCQYYAAGTRILDGYGEAKMWTGSNLISVAVGSDFPSDAHGYHSPIQLVKDRIQITDNFTGRPQGGVHAYESVDGLAAIYLRPLPGERLELVVWGADEEGLDIAARLVPLITGTGQPDFVIIDRSALWKGVEGTLAMGWLDRNWEVTRNSYFS